MKLASRTPVIVSLTPLPLSADSRTLKQAMSVHTFGFRGIAVEGRRNSYAPGTIPFEVISLGAGERAKAPPAKPAPRPRLATSPVSAPELAHSGNGVAERLKRSS